MFYFVLMKLTEHYIRIDSINTKFDNRPHSLAFALGRMGAIEH